MGRKKVSITQADKARANTVIAWMKSEGFCFESNDADILRRLLWPFFAKHRIAAQQPKPATRKASQ